MMKRNIDDDVKKKKTLRFFKSYALIEKSYA